MSLAAEATLGYERWLAQAERLSKRMELRLKESEEKVSDLDARASIAKQRIAMVERELESSRDAQKQLQAELEAARAQAAADRQQLQVRATELPILILISFCRGHAQELSHVASWLACQAVTVLRTL